MQFKQKRPFLCSNAQVMHYGAKCAALETLNTLFVVNSYLFECFYKEKGNVPLVRFEESFKIFSAHEYF